jgi:hypothetical protein
LVQYQCQLIIKRVYLVILINIGYNNKHLDSNLFIPICTIDKRGMDAVLQFPSLIDELSDFGGDADGTYGMIQ